MNVIIKLLRPENVGGNEWMVRDVVNLSKTLKFSSMCASVDYASLKLHVFGHFIILKPSECIQSKQTSDIIT